MHEDKYNFKFYEKKFKCIYTSQSFDSQRVSITPSSFRLEYCKKDNVIYIPNLDVFNDKRMKKCF